MVNPVAVFAFKPPYDQYDWLTVQLTECAFSAPSNDQHPVAVGAMRSLTAPYIKVFSILVLRSR